MLPYPPLLPLDSAHASLAVSDFAAARRSLGRVRNRRAGAAPGMLSWDYRFAEASTLLQARDTATAFADLLAAIEDLPNMSYYTLSYVAQAAALRRSILLADSLSRVVDRKENLERRARLMQHAAALARRE